MSEAGDLIRAAFPVTHGWETTAWREGRKPKVHVFKAEVWIGEGDEPSVVSVRGYGATRREAKQNCLVAWMTARNLDK